MWWVLVIQAVFVAALVLYLYNVYASYQKRPWYVTAAVLLGWYASFSLVILIPTDVASTRQEDCLLTQNVTNAACNEPWLYVSPDTRKALWESLYWITFVSCWAIFPIMQEYTLSGDFTAWEKFKYAIKSNLIFYGVAGGLGVVGMIYIGIANSLNAQSLYSLTIGLSNTWGLLLLVVFIGHGSVEVPRSLWYQSNNMLQLRYYQYELASLDHNVADAEAYLAKKLRKVKSLDLRVSADDPYRPYVDKIIANCPSQYGLIGEGAGHATLSYNKLVTLNLKLLNAAHNAAMYKACAFLCGAPLSFELSHYLRISLYEHALRKAIELEDILDSQGVGHVKWTVPRERTGQLGHWIEIAEYYWYVHLHNKARLLLFAICLVLSIALVWSEVTFFCNPADGRPDLSIFSILTHLSFISDFMLQLVVFIPVLYMSACTTWSLFSLRLYNYYRLIPQRQTDSSSLLFSATYLSRLTAPLVYNYLFMIHSRDCAFIQVMGQGVVLSVFNTYFPILVVLICLATLFNVYQRLLEIADVPKFQFDTEWHHQHIDDGRDILIRERERLARRYGMEPSSPALSRPLKQIARDRELRKEKEKEMDTIRLMNSTDSWNGDDRDRDRERGGSKKDDEGPRGPDPSRFPSLARMFGRGKPAAPSADATQYGTTP